jgi:hypothetical protein
MRFKLKRMKRSKLISSLKRIRTYSWRPLEKYVFLYKRRDIYEANNLNRANCLTEQMTHATTSWEEIISSKKKIHFFLFCFV